MITLITGGASSGKSELGEKISVNINKGKMAYIATMHPYDQECQKKIDKHRQMRKGKGFETLECPHGLGNYTEKIKKYDTVLLECLSNLIANEMYIQDKTSDETIDLIKKDIKLISENVNHLIIVSNEIFSELSNYDEFTEKYVNTIGKLNRHIATIGNNVIEVVCGIPIFHKGRKDMGYENLF